MTAPHLESKPDAAPGAASTTQQPIEELATPVTPTADAAKSTQPSSPSVEYVIPAAPVDTAPTAAENLSTWWNKSVPRGARTAMTQFLMALVVVLIVLPLSSALGWFGLHNTTPASSNTSNTMSQTTTGMSPSPNAPAHQLYNPAMPPVLQGSVVNVNLTTQESVLSIANGIAYKAWTFNGTVPGPIVHVRQGQTVHFTLTNKDPKMSHSIDFHAAQTAWNVNYQPVAPGASFSFDWKANIPGAFLYHCGTPPVMEHMANGMYGAIIVDPANGWATPAQEFVLVQSEFYTQRQSDGTYGLSNAKMMQNAPDFVVFNGYANQYGHSPLAVKKGQPVRLYVVNAGPSRFSAFHVIGAIFSDTYMDGNQANRMQGNQTVTIPPGGAAVMQLTIPDAGTYPFLTHSFMDATMGALGQIKAS
ncbi:MAG: multicopper oxidase domain-containing protein [Chloroflexota bacterium]|nr:multicopper oxidase domain-containing protein [Chloroflexota bacterium]